MLTEDQTTDRLTGKLLGIDFPEPAFADGVMTADFAKAATAKIKGDILARVAEFLGEFTEFLPSKEVFLAAVEKSIDLAFKAAGRPLIARLLQPAVTQLILASAGQLYDAIATMGDDPEPRTEV